MVYRPVAHLIDLGVASLQHHLSGNHDDLSFLSEGLQAAQEIPLIVEWDSPHPVALDDNRIVPLSDILQNLRLDSRYQLEHEYSRIQPVIKHRLPCPALPVYVLDNAVLVYKGGHRIIDALKGAVALGADLSGPGSQNGLPVKHQIDPPHPVPGRKAQAVHQVFPGVGNGDADRLLRAGENDGLFRILNQVGQSRRRVGHGICSMGYDEPVIAFVLPSDLLADANPVLRLKIRAVQVKKLSD